MDARGPQLQPTPRRPCRHRRLGASSRPRTRPSCGIARSGPSPTCSPSFARSSAPGPQASAATRPCSSAPEPAMKVVASLSQSIRRRIHGGVLQGHAMEAAASPISIRPPLNPRRSSRDPPPVRPLLVPLVSRV